MRVLVVNAPKALARDLHQRDNAVERMNLLLADASNPLPAEDGCDSFVTISSRRKVDLAAIGALRKTIREFQPDIVHSFLPRSLSQTVLATIGLRKKPKIVSFYGITRVPSWREPADWITYLSPRVSMHACESYAVKSALVQGGVPEAKCEVIYNCVEKSAHVLSRQELLAKYQIPEGAFVVGTVATVRPVKGIDVLLRALIECSDIGNLFAIIAGPIHDSKAATLSHHPRLQGRIRMLGYTHNASSLMQGMDLFAMPSRKEGLCRALLEAMGQGVCPIVSDAGGMKEVVRNGIDGIVFPTEDSVALASAIRRLHATPTQITRFGCSANERVQSMCSPRVVGDRVINMYRRLVADSHQSVRSCTAAA